MQWKDEEVFHVIQKVPAGDSPYVRAKRAQLVEKDPSRAISLFWAAINARDRVDSALKDMAIVMKQLDRSEEAIEAIKSFRCLCADDSQESLDNVLLELYKRSKRIEEEIELLTRKLKNTEKVIACGGKSTKIGRSHGRKTQITLVQELSRILGNLAWAYLQQNDYESAERYYMKALSLESDKNKQCNLAICLIHLNRIAEAKSLLQAVRASSRNESYAKSFEHASWMLTELESQSMLQPTDDKEDKSNKILSSCTYINGREEYVSRFMVPRRCKKFCYPKTPCESSNGATVTSTKIEASAVQKKAHALPAGVITNSISPVTQPRRPSRIFNNKEQRNRRGKEDATDSPHWKLPIKQMTASENMQEDAVMFTQPRSSWGLGNRAQRRGRWTDDTVGGSVCKLTFENDITSEIMEAPAINNLNGKLQASTNERSEMGRPDSAAALSSPTCEDWRRRPWKIIAKVKQKQQYSGIHYHY